jgi:hypothetical protein
MAFDPTDPETKAAMDSLKSDFTDKLEAADAKNRGLLDDFKKAQAALRAKDGVSPDDLAKAEADADAWKAKATAAEKLARDATKAAETATKALETETGATRKLLVENGLREALTAVGVTNPAMQKAAMAMLASGVEVVTEGEARIAKAGGKVLAEFAKEWAAGDEGKNFVSAAINGGGGAQGGGGATSGKAISSAEFSALPAKAKAAKMAEGYVIADAA